MGWDWAVHPGEVLAEKLEEMGMSQTQLAHRTGLSLQHVNQICRGRVGISADVAVRLEYATSIAASVWVNLDGAYRLAQARQRHG